MHFTNQLFKIRPSSQSTARKYHSRMGRFLAPMEDPVLLEIAKKYNKEPSQVLLRYLLEYGVAVVPKGNDPSRIKTSFNVLDFDLSKEDIERLSALDKGENGRVMGSRGIIGLVNALEKHPQYPFPN